MNNIKLIIFVISINASYQSNANSKLFILIGPSGVGKTTLIHQLQESGIDLNSVVTTTTRAQRSYEIEAKDYFFLSKDEFKSQDHNNALLATTMIYGNFYGICKKYIAEKLQSNQNLACCLTADGAQQVKSALGNQVITIFIVPPSLEELKKRLQQRLTENESTLQIRLANAALEMQQQDSFDYKIVNDDLNVAAEELTNIFLQETK